MICELGAALLQQHEQTNRQIDQSDEGQVQSLFQLLIERRNLEVDIINGMLNAVDVLEYRIDVQNRISSVVSDSLVLKIMRYRFRAIDVLIIKISRTRFHISGESGLTDLACTPSGVSTHSIPSVATAGTLSLSLRLRMPITTSATVIARTAMSLVVLVSSFISLIPLGRVQGGRNPVSSSKYYSRWDRGLQPTE